MAPRPTDPADLLAEVDARLTAAMPDPACELDHSDPWELLVVTILSAQAKDAVINEIRPALFARWPDPAALADAPLDELEIVIKRSGYFRKKAKAIQACAAALVADHEGRVPQTHEALTALPGASHKTANLVLGVAFGVASGIVVDTHVARVSARLGLVPAGKRPPAIEAQLCALAPRDTWIALSHRLILHGRHLCTAIAPACPVCPLHELCPSSEAAPEGAWTERAADEGALVAVRGDRERAGGSVDGGAQRSPPRAPAPSEIAQLEFHTLEGPTRSQEGEDEEDDF